MYVLSYYLNNTYRTVEKNIMKLQSVIVKIHWRILKWSFKAIFRWDEYAAKV